MLFDEDGFVGLPRGGFELFSIPQREPRRRRILETIHPPLKLLGERLVRGLGRKLPQRLHAHLPQLNWPPGYQPFCTWLALSYEAHGYQEGPQLNLGVHADHVSVRLGWDTRPDLFGRFEFLCRFGGLDRQLVDLCGGFGLKVRVYASARWPQGSRLTFESATEIGRSFDEVRRRGVWWEIGYRFELPQRIEEVSSAEFADRSFELFSLLCPLYDRVAKH